VSRGIANALDVERLSVAYGKVLAVRGVSLAVAPGTIVTVIGPNGAGKTTLLGAIAGLLPATGVVRCFGDDARTWPVEERVRRGVVLVPEKRELFVSMSVADNLLLGGFTQQRERRPGRLTAARAGSERSERGGIFQRGERRTRTLLADVYERFPRLAERRTQLAGTLSGGERQMLALGRALMAAPRVLLLDEPSLGLAPLVVRDIFSIIAALRASGVAVLLVEQNARAALRIADYGYVLETGELAFEGPSGELAANPRVAATYLGQGDKARSTRASARATPSG
jgi:branched-chain amino acid transport system ATP-binding protein